MVNPLIRAGQQVTSTKPDEHKPDLPVMERVVGDNHPYRGMENHGIIDDTDPTFTEPWNLEATQTGVTYVKEVEEENPIPVVIRNTAGREYTQHRIHHWTFDGNQTRQILPRNPRRTKARIYNIGNQVIAISDSPTVGMFNGYVLNAANPSLDTGSQEEWYAWNNGAAGNNCEIQIYEEFTVDLP